MFTIIVTYIQPIHEVDRHLEAHRAYLRQGYADKVLIASGGRAPRTGGVIMSRHKTREEALRFVQSDPFYIENVAEFEIIEWNPTMRLSPEELLVEAFN